MKIRLTIGKLMIEIETESEEVNIERVKEHDSSQSKLSDYASNMEEFEPQFCDFCMDPDRCSCDHRWGSELVRLNDSSNRGRPLGARDLQKREPSHCSTCGAAHRKATMRRAGADGRPHCVECDPNIAMREFLFGGV